MARKATKFNHAFEPEFLQGRKDISPVMLAAARGDIDAVVNILNQKQDELFRTNKDGNTLLLLAVANNHVDLTHLLLEAKSDMSHRNLFQMDALDYATMEGGNNNPTAKAVLSHCDYILPESIEGTYWVESEKTKEFLVDRGLRVVKSSLIGRTPDFSDPFSRGSDYRSEWIKSINSMAAVVRKGCLLLSENMGYLERDAVLTGFLEVPAENRCVFITQQKTIVRFSAAVKTIYSESFERRMVEVCREGNALAVVGLLKAKSSPNSEDHLGQTALMHAAREGDPKILRCLLVAKARVNTTNKEGYSAFLLAAVNRHEGAVKLLLRAKADPDAPTFRGNKALEFVKHQGLEDILTTISTNKSGEAAGGKKKKSDGGEGKKSRLAKMMGLFSAKSSS
jgi:ankyrin repeat protein